MISTRRAPQKYFSSIDCTCAGGSRLKRVLCFSATQLLESAQSPHPDAPMRKAFTGCAIPAGNDIGDLEFITVEEAKLRCGEDPACKGFTFEGSDPEGPLSGGPVWINLKAPYATPSAQERPILAETR